MTGTRRRILFVDDQSNILGGLRRSLHRQRGNWDMTFHTDAHEALADMAVTPFDVIVSDMRMPGMDGGQLLAEVRRRHPQTSRVILSGHADRASIISAIGPTQQYLAKPCDVDLLVTTVERLLVIRDLVTDEHLQGVLGGVDSLPKPPSIYEDMVALSTDPDASLKDAVALVAADVGTSAEVLRLVNTAFFGLGTHVASVERAVALLGMDTLQALALAGAVFRSGVEVPGLDVKRLSDRSLTVAGRARALARLEGWPARAEADVFLAGLMHQIGLLVLAASKPEAWRELRDGAPEGLDVLDARERELFGCSVTQASAYLLGLWGFAENVVHTIAEQPAPPGDLGVAAPAHVLSVARRLEWFGPGDVRPVPGSFVDPARWAAWSAHLGV